MPLLSRNHTLQHNYQPYADKTLCSNKHNASLFYDNQHWNSHQVAANTKYLTVNLIFAIYYYAHIHQGDEQ